MSNIIDLKQAVNNVRPKQLDPESQKLRYHALEVYDYIHRVELGLVSLENKNNISFGDFSILTNPTINDNMGEQV